ncbi:MAG: tetratricopeptide (TPR) repeat protein [Pseudohongiellaceae bacterium]|jgi:tetratricopeptide (TPR) repeat protein
MSLEEYSKKRFLIVDELDSFRFSTKKTLMELGLKLIDSASSAQEVVSGFENINYDIVLCNYELGKGKNGQELLEELRHRKLLKFTGLFFIISAEVEKGKVMGTIENEPDGYLVKPVTPKDLKVRILKSLQMKDAMRTIDTATDEGDYHAAISFCDRKIADKDRYLVRTLKTKAWLLTKIKEYDQAKKTYEIALQADDFTWAQYGLAKIAVKQKDFLYATDLLKRIISKDPNQLEATDLLAQIYKLQNNIPEAQALVQQAISFSPNALLRQKELADLCIQNNQEEEAISAFRKMVKLSDKSVFAKPQQFFDFANYLASTSKDDEIPENNPHVKEAFELIKKGAKRFASKLQIDEQSKLVTANIHATIGNIEEAQAIFDQVMITAPNTEPTLDADSFQVAAATLKTLGKDEEAKKLLEQAADLAHDDDEFVSRIYNQLNTDVTSKSKKEAASINKLGIKLYSEGNIEQSAINLRKAVPLTPRHISLNLNLAQVLLKLHKTTKNDDLLDEIALYLNKVRHTPKHHREFKRYEFLVNQLSSRNTTQV